MLSLLPSRRETNEKTLRQKFSVLENCSESQFNMMISKSSLKTLFEGTSKTCTVVESLFNTPLVSNAQVSCPMLDFRSTPDKLEKLLKAIKPKLGKGWRNEDLNDVSLIFVTE